jgi:hypothetical protein
MRLELSVVGFGVIAALAVVTSAGAPAEPGPVRGTPQRGPAGTVVTISEVDDVCPGQMTIFLAEQRDDPERIGEQSFTPPSEAFTVPAVAPGAYQVLLACPDRGLGGTRFIVEPSAVSVDPRLAGEPDLPDPRTDAPGSTEPTTGRAGPACAARVSQREIREGREPRRWVGSLIR